MISAVECVHESSLEVHDHPSTMDGRLPGSFAHNDNASSQTWFAFNVILFDSFGYLLDRTMYLHGIGYLVLFQPAVGVVKTMIATGTLHVYGGDDGGCGTAVAANPDLKSSGISEREIRYGSEEVAAGFLINSS